MNFNQRLKKVDNNIHRKKQNTRIIVISRIIVILGLVVVIIFILLVSLILIS